MRVGCQGGCREQEMSGGVQEASWQAGRVCMEGCVAGAGFVLVVGGVRRKCGRLTVDNGDTFNCR